MGTSTFDTSIDTFTDPATGQVVDSDRIRTIIDAVKKVEAKLGVAGSTVTTSHTYRLDRRDEVGPLVNVKSLGVSTSNSAATNTTAIQNGINAFAAFGIPGILYFPAGTYQTNAITITSDKISLMGAGRAKTTLEYKGSGSDGAHISITGTEVSSPDNRLEENRISELKLKNSGNGLSTGIKIDSATHFIIDRVAFSAYRKSAIACRYAMDATVNECLFDFCGSANDANHPAVYLGERSNSIRFMNCRWENTTDRMLWVEPDGQPVNKFRFYGCKFETSTVDGNGAGGDEAMFLLDACDFVTFTDCDFTFQRRQGNGSTPTHAVIPAMFKFTDASAISFNSCYFTTGSNGAIQTFTTWFDVAGGNKGLTWRDCQFSSGDDAAPPDETFTWTGTNTLIKRSGCSWVYNGGSAAPTMDSGSPTSASTL